MGIVSAISELSVRPLGGIVGAADSLLRPATLLDDLGKLGDAARPVVIQGGLSTDGYMYEPLADLLRNRGFRDVTTTSLDFHGYASFERDAANLAELVANASARSKAAGGDGLVTVIAHSKGGLTARWYLQRMGGVANVDQLITLGTPHNGSAPYGTRLAALGAMLPRVPGSAGVTQLSSASREVRGLNRDLRAFMETARAANPDFRIVSLAGDMDLPLLRATDGIVSNGASRLDTSIDGLHNVVFRGHGAHHGAIAGQFGVHEPTLRAMTLLAAGRPVEQAAEGAALVMSREVAGSAGAAGYALGGPTSSR